MFNINSFKLTDKVAIITGGASGLGEYYTRAMLTVGAKVMVVSHSERGWDRLRPSPQSLVARSPSSPKTSPQKTPRKRLLTPPWTNTAASTS